MSSDDVEEKKNCKVDYGKWRQKIPFPSQDALEEADAHDLGLAVALCRRNTCAVLRLQMLPVESQVAPSETGVHIWFFVVSLLLLLILLEIQTSVLAQGHIEIFHRPRAAQGLVC